MGLSINQNIMAMNAYRNLSGTQSGLSKSLEKLSSGFRINRAADDAAGLAISEGLRSQVRGNKQAVRNAQDGISVVQTAEGALNEVHSILQRMRELVVQGANDSNDTNARKDIATELDGLQKEVARIGNVTNFNGTKLLDNSHVVGKEFNFQVGANSSDDDIIKVATIDVGAVATALAVHEDDGDGTSGKITVKDNATARASLGVIDEQIQAVSTGRATLGAVQNRFEHTINNLNVAVENLSASESRIRDTDMASEMMQFTKNQILSQAGTAMLAQANQVPNGVLQLLR